MNDGPLRPADLVRAARSRAGLTQRALAERLRETARVDRFVKVARRV